MGGRIPPKLRAMFLSVTEGGKFGTDVCDNLSGNLADILSRDGPAPSSPVTHQGVSNGRGNTEQQSWGNSRRPGEWPHSKRILSLPRGNKISTFCGRLSTVRFFYCRVSIDPTLCHHLLNEGSEGDHRTKGEQEEGRTRTR